MDIMLAYHDFFDLIFKEICFKLDSYLDLDERDLEFSKDEKLEELNDSYSAECAFLSHPLDAELLKEKAALAINEGDDTMYFIVLYVNIPQLEFEWSADMTKPFIDFLIAATDNDDVMVKAAKDEAKDGTVSDFVIAYEKHMAKRRN